MKQNCLKTIDDIELISSNTLRMKINGQSMDCDLNVQEPER